MLRDDVEANCRVFLDLCEKAGLKVLVTETVRDEEYQAQLYDQGRTKSGSIVTNVKYPTFHWNKAALAFDICQNIKGHEYDNADFFKKCGEIGKKVGFSWGGDWKSFVDKPHFQWDEHGKYTGSMIRAGKRPGTMPLYGKENTGGDFEMQTLKNGSIGTQVKVLQFLLNHAGYNAGTIDGKFGKNTLNALKTYQKKMGLVVDGVCGAKTWAKLLA